MLASFSCVFKELTLIKKRIKNIFKKKKEKFMTPPQWLCFSK